LKLLAWSITEELRAEDQIQSSAVLSNIVQTYLTRSLRLAPKAMINEIALFSSPRESDVIPSAGANIERGGQASFLSQPPARTSVAACRSTVDRGASLHSPHNPHIIESRPASISS
jgi:hypothetical protein